MRKFHKHTNYVSPGRYFVVNNDMVSPGAVVQVGMTWYRITPSGGWRKALPDEISSEIIKREISAQQKLRTNGTPSLSR